MLLLSSSRLPFLALVFLVALGTSSASAAGARRPNVLRFVIDDMSPHFAINGEKLVVTPHVDRLAAARLEREGLLEDTLIVFMTDHGISHARGKQFLYDEGTHVPFIVCGPRAARGDVRTDLIEPIDMAAVSLTAAVLAWNRSMPPDNGPHNESNHNLARFQPSGPCSGIKRSLTDGGIRVPAIAWWRGTVPAVATTGHVISCS